VKRSKIGVLLAGLLAVAALGACDLLGFGVDYEVSGSGLVTSGMGETIEGYFHFKNTGRTDGTVDITWKVYLSTNDRELDESDELIASGTILPVAAGDVGNISFSGGTWPTTAGPCSVIMTMSSPEDRNSRNNVIGENVTLS